MEYAWRHIAPVSGRIVFKSPFIPVGICSSLGGRERTCRLAVFLVVANRGFCPQIAASGFCFVANCFPATSADYHLQPSTLYGPADTFLAFFGSGCIIGTTAFIVTCFTSHALRHMFTWLLPLQNNKITNHKQPVLCFCPHPLVSSKLPAIAFSSPPSLLPTHFVCM